MYSILRQIGLLCGWLVNRLPNTCKQSVDVFFSMVVYFYESMIGVDLVGSGPLPWRGKECCRVAHFVIFKSHGIER